VLDSYLNRTNKSNLINSLKYDLIRFFDHLGVAYFFLATLYVTVPSRAQHAANVCI